MLIRSTAGGRCPMCGANHAACGPPTRVTPVDIPARKERTAMGQVRKYKVTVNGHETVMKLSDKDVERYPDAQPVDEPASTTTSADTSAETKSRTATNKARTAANK